MRICARAFILGMGRSGRAVARACQELDIPFTAFDDKKIQEKELPYTVHSTVAPYPYEEGTVCVVAPGIRMDHPLLNFCRENNFEIISEVEFAYRMVKSDIPIMVAVTGTNGKTTVVMLIEHMLRKKGIAVEAIGNIGTPMAEAFLRPRSEFPDCFVVEISSFQLMTTTSQMFSHAICLNVSPNHLDWHSSMDEYVNAKRRLGDLVRPGGSFVFTNFGTIERFYEVFPQAARHDGENFSAAVCVAQKFGVSLDEALSYYKTFEKPLHRIECIGSRDGIRYYDDSKSTNVAATLAAVSSIEGSVALIAGGVHKGAPYLPWKDPFIGKVFAIIAIGQAALQIKSELGDAIEVVLAHSMQEAVQKASCFACKPYSVLLSPGCSSLDMFIDYKDRGNRFTESVMALGGL